MCQVAAVVDTTPEVVVDTPAVAADTPLGVGIPAVAVTKGVASSVSTDKLL